MILAILSDEKIKELKEEAELEDYSLYAYPILPGINVADGMLQMRNVFLYYKLP